MNLIHLAVIVLIAYGSLATMGFVMPAHDINGDCPFSPFYVDCMFLGDVEATLHHLNAYSSSFTTLPVLVSILVSLLMVYVVTGVDYKPTTIVGNLRHKIFATYTILRSRRHWLIEHYAYA